MMSQVSKPRRHPGMAVVVCLCVSGALAASGTGRFSRAVVRVNATSGLPAFIEFAEGDRPLVPEFLTALASTYALAPESSFVLTRSETDALGETVRRYQQLYKKIPIVGAEYIVHERNGLVRAANGSLVRDLRLDATRTLTEEAALAVALNHVGAMAYMWDDAFWENELKARMKDDAATYFPRGELGWVPTTFGVPTPPPSFVLAYRFDIHASSPWSAQRVFVDAASGSIVATLPLESNCSSATVNTIFDGGQTIFTDLYTATNFRLRDNCQTAAVRVRDWNSTTLTPNPVEIQNTTNTWTTTNERFGATVLWDTEQSYQYYLNAFGRASYDNANGSVEGYVNAVFNCSPPAGCTTTNNASMTFSGGTMKVGLGSSGTLGNSFSTLDIIGHEYTHAVTGSSANLVYSNESGALNESFSDIFGEAIENASTGPNDWLIGNDRTSGAFRSISNPNTFSDPDTYLGTFWFTGTGDNGGVHTNSGVQNFWFFLLSQGGSGTNDNGWAYSFSGIGIVKSAAIAFRNLTSYLTSSSVYNDARTGSIAAAGDLYGANSVEWRTVIKAWRAVGIDPCVVTCPANVAVPNTPDQCGAIVNYASPTDNGQCYTVTTSQASGTFFPVGTTIVTATSTSGVTCTFNVTVNDTQPPSITCPANVTAPNDPGLCSAVVNFPAPATSDNCPGLAAPVCVPPSGSVFPKGTSSVTCSVTDPSANSAACGFSVTVNDVEPPRVVCAVQIAELWPANHNLRNVGLAASAIDNCPGPLPLAVAVWSDEDDETPTGDGSFSPDAKNIGVGTLRLRAERIGNEDGRVYLDRVSTVDTSGNRGWACCTHTVPHAENYASLSSIAGQAAAAESTCDASGEPPPEFHVCGDGPVVGPKQ